MTELLAHQRELLERTRDLPGYALLWEMRVGKTLPTVRTAAYLYDAGKVDAVLVVAPNGVHLNWSRVAVPDERPDDTVVEWSSGRAGNVGYRRALAAAVRDRSRLLWACVNVEAVATPRCSRFLDWLVQERRVLLVVDESHAIKNPRAKRTKALHALAYASREVRKFTKPGLDGRATFFNEIAARVPYRRLLTGTPSTQGPFDLWGQFYLVDPAVLGPRFVPFRQRYGVFRRRQFGRGPSFDELVEYRDLDHLQRRTAPYASRLTQGEVFDLPPLTPEPERPLLFELAPHQRRVYETLRRELLVRLDGGETFTAPQAITLLMRLQQISRGFLADGDRVVDLGGPRPAVAAALGWVEQLEGKFVVWCRFRADVATLVAALDEAGYPVVRYDGSVPAAERPEALERFRLPEVRGLVGTPATGGLGVDLSAADAMLFYSYGYNLGEHDQAIARMQGMNQASAALLLRYLVAADTPDLRCLRVLAAKRDLARTVTGDELRGLLAT